MVGDGAMTLSTVYNFCFETNNYYQDKKIIYIVSRARVGDPLMLKSRIVRSPAIKVIDGPFQDI